MPDAYTFDEGNGSVRTFKSRKALYDHMADNGHVILEGDDAPSFAAHAARKNAKQALERIQSESTHVDAIAIAGGK